MLGVERLARARCRAARAQVWRPVIVVSGEEDEFRSGSRAATMTTARGATVRWSSGSWCGTRQRGLLARSVHGMRWNARSIREVLSLESWESVNELHLWMRGDATPAIYAQHRDAFYQHVRRSTQLTLGLLRSTMLHDEPLDFMWLGVLLERVNQTARMLDVHQPRVQNLPRRHEVVETALWLVDAARAVGSEAFLKRAAGRVQLRGRRPVPGLRARVPALDRVLRALGLRPPV